MDKLIVDILIRVLLRLEHSTDDDARRIVMDVKSYLFKRFFK
jgi:hypothetical protein